MPSLCVNSQLRYDGYETAASSLAHTVSSFPPPSPSSRLAHLVELGVQAEGEGIKIKDACTCMCINLPTVILCIASCLSGIIVDEASRSNPTCDRHIQPVCLGNSERWQCSITNSSLQSSNLRTLLYKSCACVDWRIVRDVALCQRLSTNST